MSVPFSRVTITKSIFVSIALATCLLLLIPLVAMKYTDAVNWSLLDFVVMGSLLFGAGSAFVLVKRKTPRKYRGAVGTVLAGALIYAWAELAVGVFTNLGS